MESKSSNPRLKQSEIANLLELSPSTTQRYIGEMNKLSLYRSPQSSKTNGKKNKKYQTPILMMLRLSQMTSK